MRRLIIATFVSLALVIPVKAHDAVHGHAAAPHQQPAAPNDAENENDPLKDAIQSLQQTILAQLAAAGFTDIKMLPTSFLISAKDRDGHVITMMASSSSIANFGQADQDQDHEQGGDTIAGAPFDQPSTTGRCALRDM
jgi:hypothetical protein